MGGPMCYNWLGAVGEHWRQRPNQRLSYKLVDGDEICHPVSLTWLNIISI